MIPIVVTVSRKGEYTVVAIKQMGRGRFPIWMGILKEERVAGGVGCHRRLGCGGGCRKGWEGERGGALRESGERQGADVMMVMIPV